VTASRHMLPGRVEMLWKRARTRLAGQRRSSSKWQAAVRARQTNVGNRVSCEAACAEKPSAGGGQR
jgi:hypothetical protein